jgi:hypothetical protein
MHGIIVPLSDHWLAEEQPQFVVKQLTNFFDIESLILNENYSINLKYGDPRLGYPK